VCDVCVRRVQEGYPDKQWFDDLETAFDAMKMPPAQRLDATFKHTVDVEVEVEPVGDTENEQIYAIGEMTGLLVDAVTQLLSVLRSVRVVAPTPGQGYVYAQAVAGVAELADGLTALIDQVDRADDLSDDDDEVMA
jgi:hypothetical protein